MVKRQNLISRISVSSSQKQPLVDVLQGKYSPLPYEIITEKTFSLFCLL